jgi:hypothetical protein
MNILGTVASQISGHLGALISGTKIYGTPKVNATNAGYGGFGYFDNKYTILTAVYSYNDTTKQTYYPDQFMTSTDGTTWTAQAVTGSPNFFYTGSLIYTGTHYVASSSTAGYIWYSTNGIAWTHKQVGGTFSFQALIWSGSGILALPDTGNTTQYFINSADPSGTWSTGSNMPAPAVNKTWYQNGKWFFTHGASQGFYYKTSISAGWTLGNLGAVDGDGIAGDGTNKLVITANSNSQIKYSSNNGTTWSTVTLTGTTNNSTARVTYEATSGNFVAFGNTYAYYSPDGATWTPVELPLSNAQNFGGFSGNGKIVISKDGYLATSSNGGVSWTNQTASANTGAPQNTTGNSVAYGNGTWVVKRGQNPDYVTGSSAQDAIIAYSTDFVN